MNNYTNAWFIHVYIHLFSQSIPPPGSYEISKSHAKSQGRVESKRPTPNSAFLSSNSRFAPPRDISLNETDVLNPGKCFINEGGGTLISYIHSIGKQKQL